MKQTFERKRHLPSFRIDLADLEVLCEKIRKQFPAKHDFYIHLGLGTQSVHASSADELRTAPELPKSVYHFYLSFSSWGPTRRCTIYAYQEFFQFGHPWVLVEGDDEPWCAGMIDLVQTFTRNHRRWYSAFRGWPLTTLALVPPYVLSTLTLAKSVVLAAVAPWAIILVLWLARPWLLPAGTLVIRAEDSWWKRHVPELSLLVAIISLAAQVVIAVKGEPAALQKPQAHPTTTAPAEAAPPSPKAPTSKPAGEIRDRP